MKYGNWKTLCYIQTHAIYAYTSICGVMMFTESVFNALVEYIEKKLPYHITVDELRLRSGYSNRQLTRIFNTYAGVSPAVYIKKLRFYRIAMELRFTAITLVEICVKYNIYDIKYFKVQFLKVLGVSPCEIKNNDAKMMFSFNVDNKKITLPKRYMTCSFVSLFDYDFILKGVKHETIRPMKDIFTSFYEIKEQNINSFCVSEKVNRPDTWSCFRFSPFDSRNYLIQQYTCIEEKPGTSNDYERVLLQGDYLLFTWVGKVEDTYPRIRNIYDNFFLNFGAIRNNGFDIERMERFSGLDNYYYFSYYIPVVITEAILIAMDV